jgi:hypothetical protein
MSRIAVATALVLAFLLSTVPVQAQPRDSGASLTVDSSWFEAALSWLENLLGGGEELEIMTTSGGSGNGNGNGGGGITIRSGPCIDPWGCPG